MIGFVVGRVFSGFSDSEFNGDQERTTVVVDERTGRIEEIISGVPDSDDLQLVHFPADSTLLPGFIDCHVHLTITTDD